MKKLNSEYINVKYNVILRHTNIKKKIVQLTTNYLHKEFLFLQKFNSDNAFKLNP